MERLISRRQIEIRVVLILTLVTVLVTAVGFTILYQITLNARVTQLVELARSQARLMEAVGKFNAFFESGEVAGTSRAATLSQIRESHRQYSGFGESGELVLAERRGDQIVFLLPAQKLDFSIPPAVSFDSELAVAMRQALSGESGVVEGLDHSGAVVVAAYEYLPFMEMGLVAEIEKSEIVAPFLTAGLVSGTMAIVLILIGTFMNIRMVRPLITKVELQTLEATLLHQASEMLATVDSVDSALQQVVDMVCELTDWSVGHVYKVSPSDAAELVPAAMWHLKDPDSYAIFREVTEKTTFRIGEGLPGRVLESGEPAWIADVQADRNFPRNRLALDIAVRSAFAFPVKARGKTLAILEFFTDHPQPEDEKFLSIVSNLGKQLGRVVERKRIEEALGAEEERFRTVTTAAQNAIVMIDQMGRVTLWNPAAERIFGWSESETLGRLVESFLIPQHHRDAHLQGFRKLPADPDEKRPSAGPWNWKP